MTRRPYLTPGRLVELTDGLGAEERSILGQVATMRLTTAAQLQRLQGVVGEAAVRRFRRRLARMTDHRLVARLERSVGGVRAGSAGFVFRLDIAGQRLANPGVTGRRPWMPRPSWLAHALAVSQVYVELATAATPKLLMFEAEPVCWRPFSGSYSGHVLKPDAYLELAIGHDELLVFLEVDRGTESMSTLSHKLDAYYRFWQAGGAEQTGGVMPLVLWAVPDTGRRQVLEQVIERQPDGVRALHRVALQSEMVSYLGTLLGDSFTADKLMKAM